MIKTVCHIFVISVVLSLNQSCTPIKRTKKDSQIVKADENSQKEEIKDKKDSEINKDKEAIVEKDIEIDANKTLDKRDHYNISLILPFNNEDRFKQYYGGMRIAAKQLEEEGIKLNIDVIDATAPDYLNKLKSGTHLIFGPNEEISLKSVIDYGKRNSITVVSPFYSLSSIEDNPNYIQLKPSLRSHYSSIIAHIKGKHKASEVVLVIKDFKSNTTNFISNYANKVLGNSITELIVTDSLIKSKKIFTSLMSSGKKVFIFANHSFKDEKYIADCFKMLKEERKGKSVFVYGMPFIKDSDIIGSDLYRDLNLRLAMSKYIDIGREEVKNFGRKYFEAYQDIATTDAFEGHDNMLFIGRSLYQYGVKFQYHLEKENSHYLQTAFMISPTKGDNSPNLIDYFENKYLDILEFDGNKFTLSQD